MSVAVELIVPFRPDVTRLIAPDDTSPGKREHRESPVNYVYKTFHKKSIDDRPTIEILNEMFAILSLLFVEEMKDLCERENWKI